MKVGRPFLAALTATSLVGSVLAVTASSPASAVSAALSCRSQLVGVTRANQVVTRLIENGTVTRQKLTSTALPYNPTNVGFYGGKTITGGTELSFTTINTDGRPRILTIKDLDADKSLTYTSKKDGHEVLLRQDAHRRGEHRRPLRADQGRCPQAGPRPGEPAGEGKGGPGEGDGLRPVHQPLAWGLQRRRFQGDADRRRRARQPRPLLRPHPPGRSVCVKSDDKGLVAKGYNWRIHAVL